MPFGTYDGLPTALRCTVSGHLFVEPPPICADGYHKTAGERCGAAESERCTAGLA